jgi:hypothetical protein
LPVSITPSHNYQYEPLISPQREQGGLSRHFGIHLWQIFTAITLILTVSSGLIYFNSIVPQNQNQEFIDITKAKTTFYNRMEYIKTYYDDNYNQNLVGVQLVQSCYSDIEGVEVSNTGLLENLETLNEQQRLVNVLNNEFNDDSYNSDYADLLQDYIIALQNYLTEIVLIFEKQEIYAEETIKIQKEAAVICSTNLETVGDNLAKFSELVNNFPINSLETMQEWVNNAIEWKDTTQNLVDYINSEEYSPEGAQELVTQFREQYIGVFSTAFDYDTYTTTIEKLYNDAINALRKVEEFEQGYIANNKLVEGNTIFVTLKDTE